MQRLFTAAALAALTLPAPAGAEGFKPSDNCLQTLQGITDTDRLLLGAWIMGYLDKTNDQGSLIRMDNAMVVIQNLAEICVKNPQATILDVVQANQRNTPDTAGTEAHAKAFLSKFLEPGADRAALTAGLRPTEADIRAVYAEPLAGKLVQMYDDMFQPGVEIGPKQHQTEVMVWRGTTGALRGGAPVLREFPGGYKDVLPYMQGNFPIVRFKFVEPGETLGLAFDGLIYIGERWVLMPKPWRALEN